MSVINGDCLEELPKLEPNSIDMILTDLPYGVTARNNWDSMIPMHVLWNMWNRIKHETTPTVLTSTQPFTTTVINSNIDNFKYEWIWVKNRGSGFLNAKKQPMRHHEQISIFYDKQCCYNPQMIEGEPYIKNNVSRKTSTNYGDYVVPDQVINKTGDRYPKTTLNITNSNYKSLHPTQKPVKLFEYLIKTYTNEGDTVLDCCAGSGTTGEACINTDRNYILIEKEKRYYDIIVNRLR